MKQTFTPEQNDIIHAPIEGSVFLEGFAGTGKTTTGVERLHHLLQQNVHASSILIWVPQRALAEPYMDYLTGRCPFEGSSVSILTLGGLSRRMIDLFWPLIADRAGFNNPDSPPAFLTLETAQYIMARIVRPLLDEGYFDSVKINRNRLYSQIIDNLNKSATIGFPFEEIGSKLILAEIGEPGQSRVYEDAQTCSTLFRHFCLEHNLLDFSLQVEIFTRYLWSQPICRQYLTDTYRHLIADNIEEDTPVAHDLLNDWVDENDSALFIFDQEAGYRRFLGADPTTTQNIRQKCNQVTAFSQSFGIPPALQQLSSHLSQVLLPSIPQKQPVKLSYSELQNVLEFKECQYFPDMLDWVAQKIHELVQYGTPPEEIVVLSPFLSDAMRFALSARIEAFDIPTRSHRPSRSLREEPITQALLTLAALSHPQYRLSPLLFDVTQALNMSIEGLDLVRARLLSKAVYDAKKNRQRLAPFDSIPAAIQARITYQIGERYEYLRTWIENEQNNQAQSLDIFFSRLFGEVLSQSGFTFHYDFNAGQITANLIESIQKFRWMTTDNHIKLEKPVGLEYIEMVNEGVIASQYLRNWEDETGGGVLLAPAYTFIMRNQSVRHQFWLDVGSHAWYERLYQPLTHPHVLSRHWKAGEKWTIDDDLRTNRETLNRIISGLMRRCREKIYMGFSDFGEQGDENRGMMLYTFQRTLQNISRSGEK